MFYSIRHLTQFRYDSPVSESLMEVRMHPRTEGPQRCLSFQLSVNPRAQVNLYRDYLGNSVHHFDVPGKHTQLRIVPDALVASGDYWEMLMPSQFTRPTAALTDLIAELQVERRDDPLSFLNELNA